MIDAAEAMIGTGAGASGIGGAAGVANATCTAGRWMNLLLQV